MSAPKKRLLTAGRKESLKGYHLIAPAILHLSVFTIYPIFYLLHSSLHDGSLLSKKRNFVGLDNFATLFGSVDFHTTLRNTIIYSVGLVAVLMVLASVSTVFLWIMDPQIGAINFLLRAVGLSPFPFLASSRTALASLVGMMVWKSLGYYSLLILAALQGVPKDIYEAASIDDTPRVKVFFQITLPMISPTMFFTTIVATISSFQVFETVNLMTQGGPVNSTNTLVYQIYSDAFKYLKLGIASAEGVVLLAFVGILTILYFAFLGKKVHYQ